MPCEPIIAAKSSIMKTLEPGKTYWWCRCGRSENQPFCDSSHRKQNTGCSPLEFTVEETTRRRLCRCKQTKDAPWCDDTHLELRE